MNIFVYVKLNDFHSLAVRYTKLIIIIAQSALYKLYRKKQKKRLEIDKLYSVSHSK